MGRAELIGTTEKTSWSSARYTYKLDPPFKHRKEVRAPYICDHKCDDCGFCALNFTGEVSQDYALDGSGEEIEEYYSEVEFEVGLVTVASEMDSLNLSHHLRQGTGKMRTNISVSARDKAYDWGMGTIKQFQDEVDFKEALRSIGYTVASIDTNEEL